MASRSRVPRQEVLPRWMGLFRHCWKPLTWVWVALFLSVFVNIGSSWLTTKDFVLDGTPLGWLRDHPWLTLPALFLLLMVTALAWLVSLQERTVAPGVSLTLTPKQRLQFIQGFRQEYSSRLNSSLQGKIALDLQLKERTNVLASSASLLFRDLETDDGSPLPPGTSIIEAYDRAGRGLLVLGAPGSGKTTLLLSLALELLQRAEDDLAQPLPVVLNLSSWARTEPPLAQWLSEQCVLVYGISRTLSASWIAQEQVQFLLDGLDEVGEKARAACIEAMNVYRQSHMAVLVVGSRSGEYTSQSARLLLSAAVEIQPLEMAQVRAVLKQAGKSLSTVRAALRRNAVLGDLLTTPLMLSVVILTYRDMPLKELPQGGALQEQQRVIFEHYVQRMLHRYRLSRRFSLTQTSRYLVWLAQQMQQHQLTEFHLESLQVDWLVTRRARMLYELFVPLVGGLIVGLISGPVLGVFLGLALGLFNGLVLGAFLGLFCLIGGLVMGIFFLLTELIWGLVSGFILRLAEGVFFGMVEGLAEELADGTLGIEPVERLMWSWKGDGRKLIYGLVAGLVYGLAVGLVSGLAVGLAYGLGVGVFFELVIGLSETSLTECARLKPNQGIHASGWNAIRFGLGVGLVSGLGVGLVSGLFFGLGAGLIAGLIAGLVFGGTAYLQHYVLRWFLARQHALPWRAVPFLEEMTHCVLLQRVGGGYRFVHPLLQDYFASLPLPPLS